MKERPIIFSGPMVRAILDGRKTQTRRVWTERGWCLCGVPGDRLWVKETWRPFTPEAPRIRVEYRADMSSWGIANKVNVVEGTVVENAKMFPDCARLDPRLKWKSARFMPRWASRILLEVVSVRVERVQDISDEDAQAEGAEMAKNVTGPMFGTYRGAFSRLWDSINAKRGHGWEKNPWVWVVEFRRIKA